MIFNRSDGLFVENPTSLISKNRLNLNYGILFLNDAHYKVRELHLTNAS